MFRGKIMKRYNQYTYEVGIIQSDGTYRVLACFETLQEANNYAKLNGGTVYKIK